jgi:hypothetical protein
MGSGESTGEIQGLAKDCGLYPASLASDDPKFAGFKS